MTAPKLDTKLNSMGQKVAKSVRGADRAVNGTCCLNFLVLFTTILFSAVLYINYLASNPDKSFGLFERGVSNVSRTHPLNITPAGWTFSIWGVIYSLQLSWVVYTITLLCRSTPSGPALTNPPVLTASFFMFFNVSSILNVSWLVVWDRLLFLAAAIFILSQAVSLYITVATAASRIIQFRETLVDASRKTELAFLNIAVLNGVSMYATWVTVATGINVGVVLAYKWVEPLPVESASIICLAVIAVCFIIYAALDFSILEKFTRNSVAPYLTIVWALAGIVSKNWDSDDLKVSSIVAAVMLGSACLATLLKIVVSVYRAKGEAYQYRLMKNRPE